MKRLIKTITGFMAMALIAVGLSGCFFPESVTRNIRVIAQAEVDGKIVEGSAVMGLRWQAGDNGRMYIKTNTDAVILDLDDRGAVYILDGYMTDNNLSNFGYWPLLVMRTFGIKANGSLEDFPTLRSAQGRYPVKPLIGRPKTLPLMITFKDEAKLETMFEVKPEDFSKVLGSGVRFAGLWFEFTNDPVTEVIGHRLPIVVKPNDSYWTAFPKKDDQGNCIPSAKKAFPYKIGKSGFMHRGFQ